MKKILLVVAALLLVVTLAACNNQKKEGNSTENSGASNEQKNADNNSNSTDSSNTSNKNQNNNSSGNSSNNNNEQHRSNNVPKDQAASFCEQSGGKIETKQREKDGKNYGSYDVCVMADNMECEDWALFHSYCPKTGVKVTGYNKDEEVYCAVLGGEVLTTSERCKFNNGAVCRLKDLYEGKCQLHFNEPATAWEYKKYDKPSVYVGYQTNREYFKGVGSKDKDDLLELEVNITKVDDISENAGLGYNRANAKSDEKSLAKGDYGVKDIDNPIQKSMQVVQLVDENQGGDKDYAKEFIVLNRNDKDCEVDFEQIAIFYNNGYQIIVKLYGDKDEIISDNSDYFHHDRDKCGDNKVWNTSKSSSIEERFYKDLADNKIIQGAAFNWYDAFNQIIENVIVD